jgi:hypothetical protein
MLPGGDSPARTSHDQHETEHQRKNMHFIHYLRICIYRSRLSPNLAAGHLSRHAGPK